MSEAKTYHPPRLESLTSTEAGGAPIPRLGATMMTRELDESPWPRQTHRAAAAELHAPATQIVRNRDDYLGQNADIGRRLTEDQCELFVGGDPVLMLEVEFDRLGPEFIALHDVGGSSSPRLIAALAAATGTAVQRLTVRRQGAGVALAVIQFVELPLASRKRLRVYSTDVNADTVTRQQIAMLLLARSKLAVLMVTELPQHAVQNLLDPVRSAMHELEWPNREVLVLPLGSAVSLAGIAGQLSGPPGLVVRVTPQASRPNDAWGFISGAWNRLQASPGETARATSPAPAPAATPPAPPSAFQPTEMMSGHYPPTEPMELGPPSVAPPPEPRPLMGQVLPTVGGTDWHEFAQRCLGVKGVLAACAFDLHSRRPVGEAGGGFSADRLAERGTTLMAALADGGRALGVGSDAREALLSYAGHHLLLRPVPGHPGTVLLAVIDARIGNPVLAKLQLERVEPR